MFEQSALPVEVGEAEGISKENFMDAVEEEEAHGRIQCETDSILEEAMEILDQ